MKSSSTIVIKVNNTFFFKMEAALESIGLEKIKRTNDGNPTLEDGEEILESFDDIQLIIGSDINRGIGKLLICDGYESSN